MFPFSQKIMGKIAFKSAIILLLLLFWFWGGIVEPYFMLELDDREVELDSWPENLNGLKVAVVGDFHAGAGPCELSRIRRAVAATNEMKADIILLVGDFVNSSFYMTNAEPEAYAKELSALKAPLGVYAIMGNHDARYGVKKVFEILRMAKIKILSDSGALVKSPRGDFYVAGLSDYYSNEYSYTKAFKNRPKGVPIILLAHTPSLFNEIPKEVSITLSGHTHGGQIKIPYRGALFSNNVLGNDFAEGLVSRDGKTIYITRGLGTSRIPFRFMCPPQISLLKLYKTGFAHK